MKRLITLLLLALLCVVTVSSRQSTTNIERRAAEPHRRALVIDTHLEVTTKPVIPSHMNDVSDFPKLTRGLLERGYKEEDIRKILGGNFLRVLRQATGRKYGRFHLATNVC
jgi:microsomal dipeptidase-like Zn-dependent dipeptidase